MGPRQNSWDLSVDKFITIRGIFHFKQLSMTRLYFYSALVETLVWVLIYI